MSPKKSNAPSLPKPDAKPPRELALVRHIAEQWAPAIIAEGVFSDDTERLWEVLLWRLVKQDASLQIIERELDAFFERTGVDAKIPHPLPDDKTHEGWVSEMTGDRAYQWGELGFLVGLGVGMKLGPDAFAPPSGVSGKGGAR